jgi:hypothetical protein
MANGTAHQMNMLRKPKTSIGSYLNLELLIFVKKFSKILALETAPLMDKSTLLSYFIISL